MQASELYCVLVYPLVVLIPPEYVTTHKRQLYLNHNPVAFSLFTVLFFLNLSTFIISIYKACRCIILSIWMQTLMSYYLA